MLMEEVLVKSFINVKMVGKKMVPFAIPSVKTASKEWAQFAGKDVPMATQTLGLIALSPNLMAEEQVILAIANVIIITQTQAVKNGDSFGIPNASMDSTTLPAVSAHPTAQIP
jgi:hypothetical protein